MDGLLDEAVEWAPRLMVRVARRAALDMLVQGREATADVRRTALADAARELVKHEMVLCSDFQGALRSELERSARNPLDEFEGLSLMDDYQERESLEMVRARQAVLRGCEGELSEFNAFVSAALGHARVQPGANPLRPDTYARSLRSAIEHAPVARATRHEWTLPLCVALGAELAADYHHLSHKLRSGGVRAAQYINVKPQRG